MKIINQDILAIEQGTICQQVNRRTEYGSIYMALKNLKEKLSEDQYPVYFPYKMGCQNAGGNFEIIEKMLDELFPECYICKID